MAQRVQPWKVALALVVATAVAVWPHDVRGFDADRNVDGTLRRFVDRPVSVYLRTQGGPAGLSLTSQVKAVQAAIAAWQGVAGGRAPLVYGGLVRGAVGYDVEVRFDGAYVPVGGEALGETRRTTDSKGRLVAAEIVLNGRDVQWTAGPLLGQAQVRADLQGVLTHQLGHALGLGHSRDTAATMYFYGTEAALRTLSDDDERGLRWLWPADATPTAASGLCDACNQDADCRDGGLCLAWPDGARHCASACSTHDDCPIGSSCGSYRDGSACLPNEGHCKPDAVRVAIGGPCASDLACDGFCMPATPVGFCTSSCAACPPPGQCAQTSVGGLCLISGGGGLGAPCWLPSDCQNFACAASIRGGGQCTRPCGSGCPGGWRCATDNTCVPQQPVDGLAVGWPCGSGHDCASGECIATPGGRFERVCSSLCKVATDCPAGTGCTPRGDESWCLPPAKGGGIAGLPCPDSGLCGAALLCDSDPSVVLPACRQRCDPQAAAVSCGSGTVCVWMDATATEARGACRPATGGKRPLGADCSASEPCRDDLVCTRLGSGAGRCLADCHTQLGGGCASGEVCVPLQGAPYRGVCSSDGTFSAQAIAPLLPKKVNPAARNVKLPSVVAASAWTPAMAQDDITASGCSARRAAGDGGLRSAVLVGAGLAIVAYVASRRRGSRSRRQRN